MGRAAHILFHQPHTGRRLHIQPARIKHHALADQADQGMVRPSPSQLDHT